MIRDRNIDESGITGKAINYTWTAVLGTPAAAASNDIYTTAGTASASSAAAKTQPSCPRNISYQASFANTATNLSSSFTNNSLVVAGIDLLGNSVSESIPMHNLWSAGTDGVQGTKLFGSINVFSFPGIARDTDNYTASTGFSLYLGGGSNIQMPNVLTTLNQVKGVLVGTNIVPVSSASVTLTSGTGTWSAVSTTTNAGGLTTSGTRNYTVSFTTCGIAATGGTYATNKPLIVHFNPLEDLNKRGV